MRTLFLVFLGLALPITGLAAVESLQVIALRWDEGAQRLVPLATGSGTAIDSNLVLTNKHVVSNDGRMADFILLCPAHQKSTQSVHCSVAAGVTALHPIYDAALVRPLSSKVFLPSVRTSSIEPSIGSTIRLHGFPIPTDQLQNFGSTRTLAKLKEWGKTGGALKIGGDKLTITRGRVTAIAIQKGSEARYLYTDAKVNFGNSGGAAFDSFGNFIGIPTLKDTKNNALILSYAQLRDWIAGHQETKPAIRAEALKFYQESLAKAKRVRRTIARSTRKKRSRHIMRKRTPSSLTTRTDAKRRTRTLSRRIFKKTANRRHHTTRRYRRNSLASYWARKSYTRTR